MKLKKIVKGFSIILMLYGFISFISIVLVLFYPEVLQKAAELGQYDSMDSSSILIRDIPAALLFLIGGFFMYKLKKWAVYIVCGFGIYVIVTQLLLFISTIYFEPPFRDYFNLILAIIYGLPSIYIIRNRKDIFISESTN